MNSDLQSYGVDKRRDDQSMAFDYKSWRNGFILIILRLACVLGLGLLAFSLPNATSIDLVLLISL